MSPHELVFFHFIVTDYPVSDANQILNRAQLSASWTLVSVSLACFGVRGYDAAF